ncbi:unnamed protein product [Pleuronectes platessa]|uniref:Uncharacterized protein n=1 Tax=Pleuronectes platessa TaxID=8262 RepID=A0A9N7Z3L6_PLEPL|nr:unnamed protein product [Pleuronectes platessa]
MFRFLFSSLDNVTPSGLIVETHWKFIISQKNLQRVVFSRAKRQPDLKDQHSEGEGTRCRSYHSTIFLPSILILILIL